MKNKFLNRNDLINLRYGKVEQKLYDVYWIASYSGCENKTNSNPYPVNNPLQYTFSKIFNYTNSERIIKSRKIKL